jgi:hypothetical protein
MKRLSNPPQKSNICPVLIIHKVINFRLLQSELLDWKRKAKRLKMKRSVSQPDYMSSLSQFEAVNSEKGKKRAHKTII